MKAFQKDNRWWIDSGADVLICNNKKLFNEGSFKKASQSVIGINNNVLHIKGTGSVDISCEIDGKMMPLTLTNVCYAPESKYNLFSVGIADKKGFEFSFKDGKVKGYAPTGELFIGGTRQGSSQTYAIDLTTPKVMKVRHLARQITEEVKKPAKTNASKKSGMIGKQHKDSVRVLKTKASAIEEIVHTDIWRNPATKREDKEFENVDVRLLVKWVEIYESMIE